MQKNSPHYFKLLGLALLIIALFIAPRADASDVRGLKVKKAEGSVTSAYHGDRIALVIGNAAYKDSPLKNPQNDAADVSKALRQIGFSVVLLSDAGQEEMERAIDTFTRNIRTGVTALFYYAGHGVQVEGRNFLVPVGRDIQSEVEVKSRSIEVGELLEKMDRRRGSASIIILDACRNNPFARSFRSAQRGLASSTAPKNSIIIYATAPGQTAADGNGRNGVFTKHLLKGLNTHDVDIELMLRRVRLGVQQETNGKQDPFTSSNLTMEHLSLNTSGRAIHTTATMPSESLSRAPEPEQQGGDDVAMMDGVEVQMAQRPDNVLAIRLSALGSGDSADSLNWKTVAMREAEKKIWRALETKLSQSPFKLDRDVIGQIHSRGKMIAADFHDNEKTITMTYEVTMIIKK